MQEQLLLLINFGYFFCLVPGGTLLPEGETCKTEACIFNSPDEISLEIMKNWEQVFIKLMRRYKYLEKIFQVRKEKVTKLKFRNKCMEAAQMYTF